MRKKYSDNIIYSWAYGDVAGLNLDSGIIHFKTDNLNTDFNNAVVKAELNYNNRLLIAYFSIAIRLNNSYEFIEGAKTITYDITGKRPVFYKSPYKMYRHELNGTIIEISDIHWNLISSNNKYSSIVFDNDKNILNPTNVYRDDYPYYAIQGSKED